MFFDKFSMPIRVRVKIFDIVGSPIWVSSEDGQKVYDKIISVFKAGCSVQLSFTNHEIISGAFLNAAIGQFYSGEDFTEEFLQRSISLVDITDNDREMLRLSIDGSKRYFANREGYDAAWKDVVGDKE